MRSTAVAVSARVAEPPLVAVGQRVRRGQVRWLCLLNLDAARPEQMRERALLALVRDVYPDASAHELRRELDYLSMHGLLSIEMGRTQWRVKLSWRGIDVVEYTCECPAGIGRPATFAGV